MSNKRKIILSVLCLLLVVAGAYAYSVWQLSRLNTSFYFMDTPGNLIGSFSVGESNVIHQPSGNDVTFALGSRHSFIAHDDAVRLKELGYPVKFSNTLILTTAPTGQYHIYTQKVKLDVTFINPSLPDSAFVIHDVELLVRPDGTRNVIGMDILSKMVIERLWPENIVNLYKEVPPSYYEVSPIKFHDSTLGNYVRLNGRASIPLSVNDEEPRDYYLVTADKMWNYEIVQPKKNRLLATTPVEWDSIKGVYVQSRCRVNFGNRLRYSSVVYSDDVHSARYVINPLRFFDQDFVLDMPGRRLMIHRTRE